MAYRKLRPCYMHTYFEFNTPRLIIIICINMKRFYTILYLFFYHSTIDEFVVTGRSMESYSLSAIHDDPIQTRVRYVDASWSPDTNDIGRHIACFTAVDNSG